MWDMSGGGPYDFDDYIETKEDKAALDKLVEDIRAIFEEAGYSTSPSKGASQGYYISDGESQILNTRVEYIDVIVTQENGYIKFFFQLVNERDDNQVVLSRKTPIYNPPDTYYIVVDLIRDLRGILKRPYKNNEQIIDALERFVLPENYISFSNGDVETVVDEYIRQATNLKVWKKR